MSKGYSVVFENVSKRYPGVRALDDVSFSVEAGSCHGLVGENGAGKSTLGKILAGIVKADAGRVLLNGSPVHFASPADALRQGIGIVHQELLFCEDLTVAENVCLSDLPGRFGLVDWREMRRIAAERLAAVGAKVDPGVRVGDLSISKQQLVQIAASLGRGARVLVFDEPTSSLTPSETRTLLALIRRLVADGVTCIYISHRLGEVFDVCSAVTVLRDGKVVQTVRAEQARPDDVVRWMIGRELEEDIRKAPIEPKESILVEVRSLSSPGKFSDVSFSIAEGEILGFAGLVGSGRTEIARALFGIDRTVTGSLLLRGERVPFRGPGHALRRGIGLVPEDRKRHGLVLTMNIAENITLPSLHRLTTLGVVRASEERALAQKYVDLLRIRAPGIETNVATLSGGNQQKVVIAKWLAAQCDFLIVDEPTRGVDVGAKAEIHDLIRDLAAKGKAILLISSEMPELFALCNRIAVIKDGSVQGFLSREEFDEERLLRMMAGVTAAQST
jgi:ABC-type sugar transport system ATPase subunit